METHTIEVKKEQNRESSKDLALAPEERYKLEKELKKDKHRIILILGAFAGLRVEEICQCRFGWLEWKELEGKNLLYINLPVSARNTKNKYEVWKTKSRKERSTIIFEESFAHEIFQWFKHNPDGLMMSRQNVTQKIVGKHFSKIIKRHLTTHALRSTYQNYLLYEKNFDPKFIAIVLGHSDIRTTMKHYNSMNKASAESYLKGLLIKN